MRSSTAMALIVGAAGGVVSSVKSTGSLGEPGFPARSVMTAVRLLGPSLPRSPDATVKSTWPACTSAGCSVTRLGEPKACPPRKSSTWSPATASEPAVGSVTRKTVLCASAAFMRPSARSAVPPPTTNSASPGAAGAVVSSVNTFGVAAGLALPAASVMIAARLLPPSAPRSPATTVKST